MIFKFNSGTEFPTPERCYITELYNREEDEKCSLARARVPSGITTQLHALRGTEEFYVILEGEGKVEVDGRQPSLVRPLDVVRIPADKSQRITNTAAGDLIFLCVGLPRFVPDCYVNLEE